MCRNTEVWLFFPEFGFIPDFISAIIFSLTWCLYSEQTDNMVNKNTYSNFCCGFVSSLAQSTQLSSTTWYPNVTAQRRSSDLQACVPEASAWGLHTLESLLIELREAIFLSSSRKFLLIILESTMRKKSPKWFYEKKQKTKNPLYPIAVLLQCIFTLLTPTNPEGWEI